MDTRRILLANNWKCLMSISTRFWSKVEVTSADSCWIWVGASSSGSAKFRYNGKLESARRIAYQLCIGNVPDEMDVCLTCNTKNCVRPDHLILSGNNSKKMGRKRKERKVAHNPCQKISADTIKRALSEYVPYRRTFKIIAKKYGISAALLREVNKGRLRPDVDWTPKSHTKEGLR